MMAVELGQNIDGYTLAAKCDGNQITRCIPIPCLKHLLQRVEVRSQLSIDSDNDITDFKLGADGNRVCLI